MKTLLYYRANDKNPLYPKAKITIEYDRISFLDLSFDSNNRGIQAFKKFQVSYNFDIRKLSKAELPRKNHKVTHEILVNWDIINPINANSENNRYFIKLSSLQELIINWKKKAYYIQSKSLKAKIIDWLIGGAIGGIIGYLISE